MSAKVNMGEKDEVELRSPTRSEMTKRPSDKEVASCKPCRIIIMVIFIAGLLAMLVAAVIIIAVSPKCVKSCDKTSMSSVWWKKGSTYQVDRTSFTDLNGLKQKVSYLKDIGAKTVVVESLYDLSNFRALHPNVGSFEDLKQVVNELNKNDIQLLMDFYPGYTSDQSSWFMDSKDNKTSSKRNWYIWKQNPNTNWKNNVNANPWVFINNTVGESYYQYYGDDKPALNYRTPEVKKYMTETLSFWLEKGIKGFNLNGIEYLLVDKQFRNNSGNSSQKGLPGLHDILKEWQTIVKAKDAILMGAVTSPSYYGKSVKEMELNIVLNDYFATTTSVGQVNALNKTIVDFISSVPKSYGWPGWTSGSKISRLGSRISSKPTGILLNILMLTLPGMSVTYSGDEMLLSIAPVQFNTSLNKAVKVFKQASKIIMEEPALQSINMDVLYASSDVLVYYRSAPKSSSYLVALNFGSSPSTGISTSHATVKVSEGVVVLDSLLEETKNRDIKKLESFDLEANQGLIIKINK